jgi:predicted TIM-barrel fold metal-dependent hydrolase
LYNNFSPHLLYKLNSIGDERIQDIDEGRVSLQVISHGPGEAALSVCTATNDDLAAAISKNPTRLAGFAVITMSQPTAAARELTRCVKDLGFTDAPVENHSGPSLKLRRS